MVKYSVKYTAEQEKKSACASSHCACGAHATMLSPAAAPAVAKAKGASLDVHFKNVVEVTNAIKGMTLDRAKLYLDHVLEHKEAIPIKRSLGGRGRHAQAKAFRTPGSLAFWPRNATKVVKDLLINAAANADAKGLDAKKLVIVHSQSNMARKGRRRTYRAHGRINAYKSTPAHVELALQEKDATRVPKPAETKAAPRLFKRKAAARLRVPVGGGVGAGAGSA